MVVGDFWVSDEAKSNLRMIRWAICECHRLLPTALVLAVPCVVHICHRTSVPTLQRYVLANDLYRMAHVMSFSSFWRGFTAAIKQLIDMLTVVHHYEVDQASSDRLVAKQMLNLTLGFDRPPHLLPRVVGHLSGKRLGILWGLSSIGIVSLWSRSSCLGIVWGLSRNCQVAQTLARRLLGVA